MLDAQELLDTTWWEQLKVQIKKALREYLEVKSRKEREKLFGCREGWRVGGKKIVGKLEGFYFAVDSSTRFYADP